MKFERWMAIIFGSLFIAFFGGCSAYFLYISVTSGFRDFRFLAYLLISVGAILAITGLVLLVLGVKGNRSTNQGQEAENQRGNSYAIRSIFAVLGFFLLLVSGVVTVNYLWSGAGFRSAALFPAGVFLITLLSFWSWRHIVRTKSVDGKIERLNKNSGIHRS